MGRTLLSDKRVCGAGALARDFGLVIRGSYQGTSLDVPTTSAEDLGFSPCGILNRNLASLKLASC